VLDSQVPAVLIISGVNLVNIQNIFNSVKNGTILVAVNLPVDNGLVDVPRDTLVVRRELIGG